MTFFVSPKGVNNTTGTTAKFGAGGAVKIGGSFQNTGNVEVDIRANLDVIGNVVNAGNFSVKDYINGERYKLLEKAINELDGEAKENLQKSYQFLKSGNENEANTYFKKFLGYIRNHPELVTSSIQIVLQLFLR